MTQHYHIQGMGVLGSLIAWRFHQEGIPFTWEDSHSPIVAWQACTGCVYPSGDELEFSAYRTWRVWHKEPMWPKSLPQITEKAAYWFLTKKPPHSGDYEVTATVGPLRTGKYPTIQVNAQRLVKCTREFFAKLELTKAPTRHIRIVAHGFSSKRLTHYKWGWSATAQLKISPKLLDASHDLRPCIDLKRGIVSPLVYAYPKPGTVDDWYAGSSIIRQHKAKSLDIKSKIKFWREKLEELTEGLIEVADVRRPREGWRPCGVDTDERLITRIKDTFYVKPMSHSGVRMSPLVVDTLMRKIK